MANSPESLEPKIPSLASNDSLGNRSSSGSLQEDFDIAENAINSYLRQPGTTTAKDSPVPGTATMTESYTSLR